MSGHQPQIVAGRQVSSADCLLGGRSAEEDGGAFFIWKWKSASASGQSLGLGMGETSCLLACCPLAAHWTAAKGAQFAYFGRPRKFGFFFCFFFFFLFACQATKQTKKAKSNTDPKLLVAFFWLPNPSPNLNLSRPVSVF